MLLNLTQQQQIFDLLPDLRDATVLDIGCGIGRLSGPLSERAASVFGIDICDTMLLKAKEGFNKPNLQFVKSSAESLPFNDQMFDVIIAIFVLQHILDDVRFTSALHEMVRVLKPGGSILIVDGISQQKYRPTTSQVTIVRTPEDYAPLKQRCVLAFSQEVLQ